MPELVIVGRVRRAHGVRGALAVESLIDSPAAIFVSGGVVYAGDSNAKIGVIVDALLNQ